MLRFSLGMLAAGLWLAAAAAIILLGRNSPTPPERSIRSFRAARRKMAPGRRPGVRQAPADEPEEAPRESEAGAGPVEKAEAANEGSGPLDEADPELAEISAVIDAVTSEPSPQQRPHRVRVRTPPKPQPPRRAGRLTYVLVDDEGRPVP